MAPSPACPLENQDLAAAPCRCPILSPLKSTSTIPNHPNFDRTRRHARHRVSKRAQFGHSAVAAVLARVRSYRKEGCCRSTADREHFQPPHTTDRSLGILHHTSRHSETVA